VDDFKKGQHRSVVLVFDGNRYQAKLEKTNSTANQARLMWNLDLSRAFNNKYPNVLKTGLYPELKIMKINDSEYHLEFNNKLTLHEVIERDLQTEDNNTVISGGVEGEKKLVIGTRYERNSKNREDAIEIHGLKCAVCGFDFGEAYGDAGKDYIEVHHLVPLSEKGAPQKVNPETDLVCVCSNCHRMIHRRKGQVYSVEELREKMIECGSIQEIDGQLILSRKAVLRK
jgi:5-methylcytosine-specific restriction protein A